LPGYDLAASYLAAEHHPEIGGDWYDAFLVPDGRLMLTIGDISGHGIVAARFMAKLRHAARAYACIDPDPQVVMAKLNEFVHHYMADDFATAQLALITPETGDVKLVSAGHPPPLHRRAAHASYVPVRNSPPAGILRRDSTPPSATMHLDSGEALIFYTDGLVERRDEILDAGLQRLADAARRGAPDSAASLAQRVVHGCLSGTDQSDDACVLVVLRQAPSD
jgi:serine phosphatase RsbU (regulator of sigma subunit)